MSNKSWKAFSASVPGRGHIVEGMPCQDASLASAIGRPFLVVCDGRGSSKLSHFGSSKAIDVFNDQVVSMEVLLESLDQPDQRIAEEVWNTASLIFYRTLVLQQVKLSKSKCVNVSEFEFTTTAAVVGKKYMGVLHIGDGALVLRRNGQLELVAKPAKGEFANQTSFVRDGRWNRDISKVIYSDGVDALMAVTDGPQFRMIKDSIPWKVITQIFDDAAREDYQRKYILEYLTKKDWDDDIRGRDDRSIAMLVIGGGKNDAIENPPPDYIFTSPVPIDLFPAVKISEPKEKDIPSTSWSTFISVFIVLLQLLILCFFVYQSLKLSASISDLNKAIIHINLLSQEAYAPSPDRETNLHINRDYHPNIQNGPSSVRNAGSSELTDDKADNYRK
jgi:hypothetical protein